MLKEWRYARGFINSMKKAEHTLILTGAGVSTASGIPDFRSPGGLYSAIPEETFEIDFFYTKPDQYYKIARDFIHPIAEKEPDKTHQMLAKLERRGLIKGVITQNIDGLHQKAGSKNVVEFHGNVIDFHCVDCAKPYSRKNVDDKLILGSVPLCTCGGLIRPDIVFFGDPIPAYAFTSSQKMLEKTDLLVAMGTSLAVEPAASLIRSARNNGSNILIINRGKTLYDEYAVRKYDIPLEKFSEKVLKLLKVF